MTRSRHHVLSHAGIYLIARGAPGIIVFLSMPLFTRLLDPGEYGQYALVVATASLLNALLFQWLRLALVRYLPAYKDGSRAALQSTVVSVSLLLIAILGLPTAALVLLPVHVAWKAYIIPCWLLLAAQSLFELGCEYVRGAIRPWHYMGMQLAKSLATVGLGALLIVIGAGWRGPILGVSIGMMAAVVWIWRSELPGLALHINRDALRKLAEYGVPLSLTVALTLVISSSDRYLIAWKLGNDSAGYYSAAVEFTSQTLTLLMMVIQLAIFPLAVRAFEEHGREAAQEQMKLNASLLMGVGVPGAVGLIVLAPGISNAVLGPGFRGPAAQIMPLIAVGTFVAGLKAYHFDAAFQFAHRTIHQVWIVLIAAVLNIALNLVAIPRFGINGAATASVLAYLVSIVLTVQLGRRYFVLPFPKVACVQVGIAALAMGLLLFPLRRFHSLPAVGLQIVLGCGVYGLVLLAGNFMGIREWMLAKAQSSRGTKGAERRVETLGRPEDQSVEVAGSLSAGTLV